MGNARKCRVCGCTHYSPCIDKRTGEPCYWVEIDLCSACAIDAHSYFEELLFEITKSLSEKSDDDLIRVAIKKGVALNSVTEHFPAYDVALKLKNNKWTPTPKQRAAITNVLAFYIAIEKVVYAMLDADSEQVFWSNLNCK